MDACRLRVGRAVSLRTLQQQQQQQQWRRRRRLGLVLVTDAAVFDRRFSFDSICFSA